jgi:hypothetical protein
VPPLLVASATLVVIAYSCYPSYSVWIVPASTAQSLTFGLAKSRHGKKVLPLNRFAVTTCPVVHEDLRQTPFRTTWLVIGWDTPPQPRTVGQLRYGESPAGLRDTIPAQPLTTGCYEAWVHVEHGTGFITFWVIGNGSVREVTASERDSMLAISNRRGRAERLDSQRALDRCKQSYSAAKTKEDSVVVDEEVWTDTVRFGRYDCSWFRRYHSADFAGR